MKKLCVLFLSLCLLLGLAACGSTAPDNPNCGFYEGKYGEMSGYQIEIHDMYAKGFTVELSGGGKGTIVVDGTQAGLKWTLNGTSLHIEGTGLAGRDLVLDGTVADGVMVLENVMDSGVDIRLECADLLKAAPAEEQPAPEATETPVEATEAPVEATEAPVEEPETPAEPAETGASWWAGKWYGWGCYYTAGGAYADYEDSAWDVVAEIDVQGDKGSLKIWDCKDLEEAELSAKVSFGPGLTAAGRMTCESAEFAGVLYGQGYWSCDPADYPEGKLEHTFLLTFYYRDAENDNNFVEVCYVLRPWGMLWDDVKNADTSKMLYDDMMPLHYEDWYLPQLDGSAPAAPAEPETPAASAEVPGELVGSWEHSSGYTYVFAADGTGSYGRGDSKMDFTFTVEGDQLSILYTGSTSPFVTTYRIEGTTLIILDSFNSEVKYEKK